MIRPLWRHYITSATHTLYIHSCADTDRLEMSIEGMHINAGQLLDEGAKNFFVVMNKQDLIPFGDRKSTVSELRQRFEHELSRYNGKLNWKICDVPGFSAASGVGLYEALDIIHTSIQSGHRDEPLRKAKELESKNPAREQSSEADLTARIVKEGGEEADATNFWDQFLTGEIPEWNHRSHLRAGYFILLDTLLQGKRIFETAEIFLDHLRRLKELKPDRFRNTEHRTMTIFWLYNLQLAILEHKQKLNTTAWPTREDFQQVLLSSPSLMNGSLWKDYYSKDLMFTPEAKEYWRLPDLQALPDFAQITPAKPHHVRRPSQEEPYRVMRFAFVVVQRYMSSDVRRGWLIKQALASLQSTTMRLRVKNPSIPPYSETQAYFWIQVIHAALASVYGTQSSTKTPLPVTIDRLSFASFRVLFDIHPALWRGYYTAKVWEGIEARMAFVIPDLKPLPNVLNLAVRGDINEAFNRQLDNSKLGMIAELPSMEDLALRAALVLDAVSSIDKPVSPEVQTHAHLLLYLYTNLIAKSDVPSAPSYASRATSAMFNLSGPQVPTFTHKAFWTQQVLGASGRGQVNSPQTDQIVPVLTFEEFIKANLHLVYEDLPLCYYSQELLGSLEAQQGFVPSDRRKMRGFMAMEGSANKDEEDEWVVV
jgi:hypothetical protein